MLLKRKKLINYILVYDIYKLEQRMIGSMLNELAVAMSNELAMRKEVWFSNGRGEMIVDYTPLVDGDRDYDYEDAFNLISEGNALFKSRYGPFDINEYGDMRYEFSDFASEAEYEQHNERMRWDYQFLIDSIEVCKSYLLKNFRLERMV